MIKIYGNIDYTTKTNHSPLNSNTYFNHSKSWGFGVLGSGIDERRVDRRGS